MRYEMDVFQRLNHGVDNPPAIYALAMAWLRQWQSFVRGKETQPPGPIDNTSIIVNKNGQNVLKAGKISLFCLVLADFNVIYLVIIEFFLSNAQQVRTTRRYLKNFGNFS